MRISMNVCGTIVFSIQFLEEQYHIVTCGRRKAEVPTLFMATVQCVKVGEHVMGLYDCGVKMFECQNKSTRICMGKKIVCTFS